MKSNNRRSIHAASDCNDARLRGLRSSLSINPVLAIRGANEPF